MNNILDIQKIKKFYNTKWGAFIGGSILGCFAFILLYGTKILDVTYDDWLLYQWFDSDATQHYYGWVGYRNCEWMFPWGLTDALSYPQKSSVIFTDSIPHVAFFFKILSPFLPNTFQYFGLYGFLCLLLQGGISALIIKKLTGNTTYSILCSIFFIFSSSMLFKMMFQTAVASHWLILLSLYWFISGRDYSYKKKILCWSITIFLASGVHIAILAMCCIILFFYSVQNIKDLKLLKTCLLIIIPILIAISTIYLYGGLTSETNPVSTTNENGGLGYQSFNLNSLINPINDKNSTILPTLPLYAEFQNDGYQYLGFGLIIMVPVILGYILFNYKDSLLSKLKDPFCCSSIIMALFFFIFALSPKITLGNKLLFQYYPPKLILWIWEIFRASGRFFWPVFYFLIIALLVGYFQWGKQKKWLFPILFSIICIQLFDIFPGERIFCNTTISKNYTPKNLDERWNDLYSEFPYICISNTITMVEYPEYLKLASKYHNKLNIFHFAHNYPEYYQKTLRTAHYNCLNPNNETLYLLIGETEEFIDSCSINLNLQQIDDFIVGTKKISQ